jgi:hypothetical protein
VIAHRDLSAQSRGTAVQVQLRRPDDGRQAVNCSHTMDLNARSNAAVRSTDSVARVTIHHLGNRISHVLEMSVIFTGACGPPTFFGSNLRSHSWTRLLEGDALESHKNTTASPVGATWGYRQFISSGVMGRS